MTNASSFATRFLIFDPGEHTGWCCATVYKGDKYKTLLYGGTVDKNHRHVGNLIRILNVDYIIYESFHLYPGLAKSLSWNSFYPCETIGVIKYLAQILNIPCFVQSPSIKKFSGGLQDDWKQEKKNYDLYVGDTPLVQSIGDEGMTEHSKDAYLHWKYFERNTLHKLNI